MAKQIIACVAEGSVSDVDYYAGLAPRQRSSLAHEMASEVLQHYSRARTLVMLLANSLRDLGEDSTELDLAEVANDWMNDGDHISQELRLMACLQSMKDASHG